jgi:UDP-GlcNAc:undecaprenyl-phosphate GlcNAc-1-phosphate transferase
MWWGKMQSTFIVVVALALSALGTLLLCANAERVCRKLALLDIPDVRKRHRRPTPLIGGLVLGAVALPVVTAMLLEGIFEGTGQRVVAIVAGGAAAVLVGVFDDRRALSAALRLVLIIGIALGITLSNDSFVIQALNASAFGVHIPLGRFAIPLTVLSIVVLVNAINMADGKNGLVSSLLVGWFAILAMNVPPSFLPLLLILISVVGVILAFNLGGHVFLGDGGSYGFSFVLAVMTILVYNTNADFDASAALLLLAVPVADLARLIVSRSARGQSPMVGGRDHFHHHLLNRFGWPGGLVVYLSIALGPSLVGILFRPLLPLMIVLTFVCYAAAVGFSARSREEFAPLTPAE